MNKIKKTIFFILVIVCLIPNYVYANDGNYTIKSDIVTYVNHCPIRSFNINGYTAIMATDLDYYGFNVSYDNSTRSLYVNEDKSNNLVIKAEYLNGETPDGKKIYRMQYDLGKYEEQILSTDIKTYLDGEYVESFNIAGYTAIYADALSKYGSVTWLSGDRILDIRINSKIDNNWLFKDVPKEVIFNYNQATKYLKSYWQKMNIYTDSIVTTGNEYMQTDYRGRKYFDVNYKTYLFNSMIFTARVYEDGKVELQ